MFILTGCSFNMPKNNDEIPENTGSDYDYNEQITIEDPEDIEIIENNDEFNIETNDGVYNQDENIYTITSAGTYSLKGKLEGQILIEATKNDAVVLELNGVSISYDNDSPIKALAADKVEISAKKGTENIINDNRTAKTIDNSSLGEGAIHAKCDLKLKGTGTLVINGNYNNGVHATKDLDIQKLTLKVTGLNNGLKGKDGVTITSGNIQVYAKNGNGIKTDNSDISSKNNQRGKIIINGGKIYVDSLHDALDASYNVEINELDSNNPTSLSIKTGTNSVNYSKSSFVADSEKGLKAANEIIINAGKVVIAASDDAIHANYGDTLDNEEVGLGNITINDGLIQIASGDDGLHADNTLSINGGKIVVTGSVEGYEASYINISGGYSYIYGSDDGVNCMKKTFNNCAFTMTGGYLDIAVRNGDTDGIDSNGDFSLSGGVIITRGSPGTTGSRMSTGLDVDGTCSMTGGTLIAFNGLEKTPSTGNNICYAATSGSSSSHGGPGGGPGGFPGRSSSGSSSYKFESGNYKLSGDNLDISFTNDYIYGSFMIYSSDISLDTTYTLSREDVTILSWTQSSKTVTIS